MREPAYVKAFKSLVKAGADHSHVEEMIGELFGESDRATMILFAGSAEESIVWALLSRMRKHGAVKELFDPDGPIGTFSSKISLGFALELFGPETRRDLDYIRTLRNGCAHSEIPLKFLTPAVKAICDHLRLPDTDFAKVPPDWRDSTMANDLTHPKTRYVTTCHTVLNYMVALSENQPGLATLP